jgi:hypothetical protein
MWTYNSTSGKDSWDHWDDPHKMLYGDNGMVLCGPGGEIISTKHWEAFREGIEDYCYLHLLREEITSAVKAGKDTRYAQKLLDKCVNDVLENTENKQKSICTYRSMLAEEIMRLRRTLTEKKKTNTMK